MKSIKAKLQSRKASGGLLGAELTELAKTATAKDVPAPNEELNQEVRENAPLECSGRDAVAADRSMAAASVLHSRYVGSRMRTRTRPGVLADAGGGCHQLEQRVVGLLGELGMATSRRHRVNSRAFT